KRAALAANSSKLECAGGQVQIGLTIVALHPWCVGFISQSQVQGQTRKDVPVVLAVSGKGPGELVPDKTDGHSNTSCFRNAEEEIGSRIADEIDAGASRAVEDIAV